MDRSFWITRWTEGRIGFHEGSPNTLLAQHAARLPGPRVLVPLCGKSEDLAYLASLGHEVVGIELVEDAVRAFFAEHAITPTITRRGELAIYAAEAITLIAGDLFAVTPADVGPISAIYDRAALIALPPDLRRRYVEHLRALTSPGTPALLITLEYPQDQLAGPPFAVMEAEVRARYAGVELLAERPATGRVAEQGVSPLERCFAVTL